MHFLLANCALNVSLGRKVGQAAALYLFETIDSLLETSGDND
jgi:hypothetical protein